MIDGSQSPQHEHTEIFVTGCTNKDGIMLCVFLKKFMQIVPGKRSYAGGPRVLQESTK